MIARRAGTVVSLCMLFVVISGCGTQLDPRLQPNDDLREVCSWNGKSYSDEQIRGILAEIEQRRLQGYTKAAGYDAVQLKCEEESEWPQDAYILCNGCTIECVNQVYDTNPLN